MICGSLTVSILWWWGVIVSGLPAPSVPDRDVIPGNRAGRGSGDALYGVGDFGFSSVMSVPRGAQVAFAQNGFDDPAQAAH
jgi:hypothetical protein